MATYKATYVFNYLGKDYVGYKWFDTYDEAKFFLKKTALTPSGNPSRKERILEVVSPIPPFDPYPFQWYVDTYQKSLYEEEALSYFMALNHYEIE
jgi:hypothetical protein